MNLCRVGILLYSKISDTVSSYEKDLSGSLSNGSEMEHAEISKGSFG